MKALKKSEDIGAFLHLLACYRDEEAEIYNAMAPGYDRFSQSWDAGVARSALDFLMMEAADRTPQGGRVLDAGCGTGLRATEILHHLDPAELVGLDLSEAMLGMARRKRFPPSVSFVRGNFHALPFEDESFDAVVATWAMETTSNPGHAVQEMLRVVKPEGVVAYSFVQLPTDFEALEVVFADWPSDALREALAPEHLPFHDCRVSSLARFEHGLISTVILGKCCEVRPELLPKPFADPYL